MPSDRFTERRAVRDIQVTGLHTASLDRAFRIVICIDWASDFAHSSSKQACKPNDGPKPTGLKSEKWSILSRGDRVSWVETRMRASRWSSRWSRRVIRRSSMPRTCFRLWAVSRVAGRLVHVAIVRPTFYRRGMFIGVSRLRIFTDGRRRRGSTGFDPKKSDRRWESVGQVERIRRSFRLWPASIVLPGLPGRSKDLIPDDPGCRPPDARN